jgi:predicted TPR repeat methyltransferase
MLTLLVCIAVFIAHLIFAADEALSFNPSRATEYFQHANNEYLASNLEDAVKAYALAIQHDSTKADYFCNHGSALTDLNRIEEAAESYRKALALDPFHASALFNYGMLLQDLKQANLALPVYQRLVEVESGNAEAFANLGSCFYEVGRFEDAIASFKNAFRIYELTDDSTTVGYSIVKSSLLEYIGRAFVRLEKSAEARENFQAALILNPENTIAAHMMASLNGSPRDTAPAKYVSKLFDDYSQSFEASLSDLKYSVPSILVDRLLNLHTQYKVILDLGSGTGLLGKSALDKGIKIGCLLGLDLSSKMLQTSIEKECYNFLICGEIVEILDQLKVIMDSTPRSNHPMKSEYSSATVVHKYESIESLGLGELFTNRDDESVSAIVAADVFGE